MLFALNHPVRRRIIRALLHESGSAKTLGNRLGLELSLVSYHLNRVLADRCGVVDLVDEIQRRGGREKLYVLKEDLFRVHLSLATLPSEAQPLFAGYSLKEFLALTLAAIQHGTASSSGEGTLEWSQLEVDAKGWKELQRAGSTFRASIRKAEARSRDRLKSGNSEQPLRQIVTGSAIFPVAPFTVYQMFEAEEDPERHRSHG